MSYYIIKHNIPGIAFNRLVKTGTKGNTDWILGPEYWGFNADVDRYFSAEEIEALPDDLKRFVQSEFCEVVKV